MTMKLPGVLSFLSPQEAQIATFVKPAIGRELTDPFADGGALAPSVMGARILGLAARTVVPVHVHGGKEKVYVLVSLHSAPVVVVILGDKPVERPLERGKPFCVPAGCPHFVKHMGDMHCVIAVISSSQDGQDIVWEADADKLVNKKKDKP